MPPGTVRLEVVGPDVPGRLQALRDRPGVRHAAPFGHAVQILVDVDRMPDDLDGEDVRSRVILRDPATFMRMVFGVPIHGPVGALLAVVLPLVLAMLGLGLWISTKATTRDTSMQICLGMVLPTAFLSGYVFPLDSMPRAFQHVAWAIPTNWMIDAARGVILRGAGWAELGSHAATLWAMAAGALLLGMLPFRKRIA